MADSVEPVIATVRTSRGPEAAFSRFAAEFPQWWPTEYTWAGESLERIAIEPGLGGACFEVGPDGFHCDWGRVVEWEPPVRLGFSWQIGPNREPVPDRRRAGTVAVAFEPDGEDATRVVLEHAGFDRYGKGAPRYRDAMASEQGWPFILGRFADVG